MVTSPSGGAPAKTPRWDLADTEGYSGGNCVSSAPRMFSGYVGIYRRKKYVGGTTWAPRGWRARLGGGVGAPLPRATLGDALAWTPSLLAHIRSKNHVPEGFIPFGFRLISFFCETLK